MLYAVTATRRTVAVGDWQGSTQVPTFYLDSDVQGIVSCEHAARIAVEVIGPDAYGVTVMNGDGETVSFTNVEEVG